ncbi:suppressor of fused domain protein [Myroides marinus]|uniref:suppressor of fused domain protein n=1 Tax=Myroides marinus TaxID=703342 RepID=UPI00074202D4|nr:suppressor of fused domain protein [Myroides marinus]KUF43643.1 riboflavin biosynthesis protein [Myroides marinus]MDM1349739.1 suppressor of fused domain protein [Myroides marinus]MDM1356948.1 suppressor of fused domain protein [Myroides marinus]MDM1361664.1 suppressor of fused domain protein [Myroides marinus]MDM1364962.1 suppressor of fused domain protein [Myroides marinus]
MTLEEYQLKYTEEDAVGWDCIDENLKNIYEEQEPQHFASALPYNLGGEDPLNGISVFNSNKQDDHFHIISYGFSDLFYNEEAVNNDFSGYGFELTMRVKKQGDENIHWAMNLMNNLAKYVVSSGKWFEEFHFIPTNSPIRLDYDTDLVAIAFALDPELGAIDTPNGRLEFLQMVGITQKEYDMLLENPVTSETAKLIEVLRQDNPLLITDLDRK